MTSESSTIPVVVEKMYQLLRNYMARTGVGHNEHGNAWLIHPHTWTGLRRWSDYGQCMTLPTPEQPNGTSFGMPILTSLDVPEDEVRMVFGVKHPHLADLPQPILPKRLGTP